MEFHDISDWIRLAKDTVDLLRGAASLLPKGEKQQDIERKIFAAEEKLKYANAKLAKDLGMKLCDCTNPPQVMLWKEARSAHVCPNSECGRTIQRPRAEQISRETSWVRARRGGH
jgi:hypothetical protein